MNNAFIKNVQKHSNIERSSIQELAQPQIKQELPTQDKHSRVLVSVHHTVVLAVVECKIKEVELVMEDMEVVGLDMMGQRLGRLRILKCIILTRKVMVQVLVLVLE